MAAPTDDAATPRRSWRGQDYPTEADFPDGGCVLGEGDALIVAPKNPRWQWANAHCKFSSGFKLLLGVNAPESERLFPPKKRLPTAVTVKEPPVLTPIDDALPIDTATATATPIVASVGADTAIGDIQKLVPADGRADGTTVLLAIVGVAGGGAAFKLYQSWQKGRQEVELKKLEVEERKVEKQDNDHKACAAARAMLETKVAEQASQIAVLSSKLTEIEARAARANALDLEDVDFGSLEQRLLKLEAAAKKSKKKA